MEAGYTRRGLVICVAGLLLFCLLAWFTLGDEAIDPADTEHPPDVSSRRSQGNPRRDTTDATAGTLPTDASNEPIPAPREIAYGGRVLDTTGQPIAGLVPHLWGRVGEPTGEDGLFSVPLDPTDIPDFWESTCLVFSARGRQSPRIVPKPIGLHGKDEVRIPVGRGPQIQFWWLDTRKPVAGHAVTLHDRRGAAGRVLHTDRTDGQGMYFPWWEEHESRAYLDLEIEGGSIRYVLDRSHVKAHYPLHLFVPRIDGALYLEIECRDGAGHPVSGAHVSVGLAGTHGAVLNFVTDQSGRGRAHFWLTDEEYDPSEAVISSWEATWKTPRGVIRTIYRPIERGPGRKRPSVRRKAPFPIRLEYEEEIWAHGGLPVLVRTAGSGSPARPDTISGQAKTGTGEALTLDGVWEETTAATRLDPEGRRPRRLDLMTEAEGWPWPDDTPFELRVSLWYRPEVRRTITIGDVRRAVNGARPVVVTVPEPVYCARWIEVTGPDGKPRPFARCSVATRGGVRLILTDDTGRAFLGRIPAEDVCRVVAVDPITGAGGEIREIRLADAPKVTHLKLEAPKQLQLRLFRPNGNAPGGVDARLVDRAEGRAVAPVIRGVVTDDNLLTFPPATLSLYDLSIRARNVKLRRIPATEVGESMLLD